MASPLVHDLIVVGGGVVGLFHAYAAIRRGLTVALFEKNSAPTEASVRNFGACIPSAMTGSWHRHGRRSLEIYRDIHTDLADIGFAQAGGLYLASCEAEAVLLQERHALSAAAENPYPSQLLSAAECLERVPGLRKDYVKLGLLYPDDAVLNPHLVAPKLLENLVEMGMTFFPNRSVVACGDVAEEGACVLVNDGSEHVSKKVVVCNGHDLQTIFPSRFAESDIVVTKLQMLRTKPQPKGFRLPHGVFSGLSVRRYECFAECESFADVQKAEAFDVPGDVRAHGIHIIFKQQEDGSVILGDSHHYAKASEGGAGALGYELSAEVEDVILREARRIIDLPTYGVESRWYGVYAQMGGGKDDVYAQQVSKNVSILTAIGGRGMTASAGLAEENVLRLFDGAFPKPIEIPAGMA